MILPYLRLLRVGLLLSPGADVVAGMALAGAPWSGAAASAVGASICVYAAGMVLNDHADRAEDARQRPERPIPAGQVAPAAALGLGLVLLAAGVLLSPRPAFHGLLAGLVLAYDYLLKSSPIAGALTMGSLRGLNLAGGALVLAGGVPPRTVLLAAATYFVYIVAVTILGVLEDEPRVKPRAVRSLQALPPLAATLTMLAMPRPRPAAAVAMVLLLLFLGRAARRGDAWDRAAIRGSMTWLLLGTMLYTSLLALAAGRGAEAAAILGAAFLGRWISRTIAVT